MFEDHTRVRNIAIAVFVSVITFLAIYSVFWGPARRFTDSLSPARAFTVTGEEKATVAPDTARLSFSVVSEGKTPEAVTADNNKKMNSAIDFVKSQGVDAANIKTTQYSLSPRYEFDLKTRRTYVSGYSLTQTVSVKVTAIGEHLDRVTKTIGGLPNLGINQIGGVSFDVDDLDSHLADARSKAFAKARSKAEEMAKENNASLGRIISISDNRGYAPPVYRESALPFSAGMGAAAPAPAIEPGTQEVPVDVSITYELN